MGTHFAGHLTSNFFLKILSPSSLEGEGGEEGDGVDVEWEEKGDEEGWRGGEWLSSLHFN